MRQAAVLGLLLLCLALSGCSTRPLEEELLVIVLAVDQSETQEVLISIKVPGSASGGPQEDEEGGYRHLEARGRSFPEAVTMLNAITPRPINFSQTREIIIGERMARQPDFAQLLRQIDALPRFRCSAAVIICRGEASAFAKAQKPFFGARLSRYAEATLVNYAGKGFTPKTTLCDGVRDLGYGYRDPLFILGAVNDFSGEEENKGLKTQAGALPRKSAEAVEMFGAAATDGVCVRGYLSGYEMALLHLMEGHVEALSVQDTKGVPVRVTARRPAALSVDLSARPARLTAQVYCEALYPPGESFDEPGLSQLLREDMEAVLRRMQAMGCDGAGFAGAAVRQFSTVQAWEGLNWRQVYAQAEVTVQVELTCREK